MTSGRTHKLEHASPHYLPFARAFSLNVLICRRASKSIYTSRLPFLSVCKRVSSSVLVSARHVRISIFPLLSFLARILSSFHLSHHPSNQPRQNSPPLPRIRLPKRLLIPPMPLNRPRQHQQHLRRQEYPRRMKRSYEPTPACRFPTRRH